MARGENFAHRIVQSGLRLESTILSTQLVISTCDFILFQCPDPKYSWLKCHLCVYVSHCDWSSSGVNSRASIYIVTVVWRWLLRVRVVTGVFPRLLRGHSTTGVGSSSGSGSGSGSGTGAGSGGVVTSDKTQFTPSFTILLFLIEVKKLPQMNRWQSVSVTPSTLHLTWCSPHIPVYYTVRSILFHYTSHILLHLIPVLLTHMHLKTHYFNTFFLNDD